MIIMNGKIGEPLWGIPTVYDMNPDFRNFITIWKVGTEIRNNWTWFYHSGQHVILYINIKTEEKSLVGKTK